MKRAKYITVLRRPTDASLHVQYEQFNERARWYGRQFWYASLAYLAGGAVAIPGLREFGLSRGFALLAVAVVGVFVFWHLLRIRKVWARNIDIVIHIEQKLRLPETWPTKPGGHYFPLLFLVGIAFGASFVASAILLGQCYLAHWHALSSYVTGMR